MARSLSRALLAISCAVTSACASRTPAATTTTPAASAAAVAYPSTYRPVASRGH